MNVGENIKALCRSRGITIKQFEEETGLGNGFVRASVFCRTRRRCMPTR